MSNLIEGVIVFIIGSLFGGWCVYTSNKGENPITVIIKLLGKIFKVVQRKLKYTDNSDKKRRNKYDNR